MRGEFLSRSTDGDANNVQVPEDLAMILNDSSLNSKEGGDITTKDILRRYGDRAKVPTATPGTAGDAEQSRARDTRAPVVTRVNADPQAAWQAEASVRTVGNDFGTPPTIYASHANGSSDSQAQDARPSPSRGGLRGSTFDKPRTMGVAG